MDHTGAEAGTVVLMDQGSGEAREEASFKLNMKHSLAMRLEWIKV